jgi:hypothetical protein
MQEGYQIVEPKNRVSDVLTQMSIKVSDVLILLGQRCADSYHLFISKYIGPSFYVFIVLNNSLFYIIKNF